jgi:hypothetical protein
VPECLEIISFRVKPGAEAGLVEDRPRMVEQIRERHPALLSATLVHLDADTYVDLLRWRSKEEADTANADHDNIPGFVDWVAHVGELISFETATVVAK